MSDKDFGALPASPSVPTERHDTAVVSGPTPGPWHWVNPETDAHRQPGEWRASLRTVAEFGENKTEEIDGKFYTRFALPKFIVEADEIRDENMEANARLIAAAPDLLEALVLLEREMVLSGNAQSRDYGWLPAITKTRAAIAKATTASAVGTDERSEEVNQNTQVIP